MLPAQALGDGVVGFGRQHGAERRGDGLGGAFQFGEVVGPIGEQVPHLLCRQQNAPARRQGDTAAVLPRHAPGAIERQHGPGGVRGAAGQRRDLVFRHIFGTEQGVGEHLSQAQFDLALLAAGEGGEIDLQGFAQLDQQGRGDGALVVLDQVQVARGDAEPSRQRLLRQFPLGAQAADRPADQGTGHALAPLTFYTVYKFTNLSVKTPTVLRH